MRWICRNMLRYQSRGRSTLCRDTARREEVTGGGKPLSRALDSRSVKRWASRSHPLARCHRTSPSAFPAACCPWSKWPTSRVAGGKQEPAQGWARGRWVLGCWVPSPPWLARSGTSRSLRMRRARVSLCPWLSITQGSPWGHSQGVLGQVPELLGAPQLRSAMPWGSWKSKLSVSEPWWRMTGTCSTRRGLARGQHGHGKGAGVGQLPEPPPGVQQPPAPLTRLAVCWGGTHDGGWKGVTSSRRRARLVSGGRSWPAMAVGCRDGVLGLPVPCGGKRRLSWGDPACSAGCSPLAASSHEAVPESRGLWGSPLSAPSPVPGAILLFRGIGDTTAGGRCGGGMPPPAQGASWG